MAADLITLRVFVYSWFAERGQAPTVADIADALDTQPAQIWDHLQTLHDQHLLVWDPSRSLIVMAHPWSSVPLGFIVAGRNQHWWGGCAWDSFAIPALLEQTCLVATHCPGCGRPLALDVEPGRPPAGDLVAHFLIPVRRMWDDVVHTCGNQLLFCSTEHIDAWLRRHSLERGAILDLDTLWSLATGWYAKRLTREYRRRTPEEAAAFFHSINLTGEFWSTED
jgi:Alkylmercury lyase